MATLDTSAAAYQFKRVYGDKLTDLFHRQAMTYNLFMKSSRKASVRPGGAGYYFGLRQGANEAVGARLEGTYLPEPLAGSGSQGIILPRMIYGSMRMSGLAIEAGKGNIAAFVDAQGDAVADLYKSIVSDLNRQCHGDSFGLLGITSANTNPVTGSTWTATFDNDRGVRYLRKGMICDFYDTAGTAIDVTATSVRISSINPNTRVVTFEAAAGSYKAFHPIVAAQSYTETTEQIDSTSQLVRYGAREVAHATTDTSNEMMGLLGMYDDGSLLGTFEGVTAITTTNKEFQANVLSNSSVNRELSIDLMLAAMDMTSARADNANASIIRMGLGQRRKYFGLLAPDVRYAPQKLLGGYEKLAFSQNAGVSIVVDPYTQPNRLFFETDNAIKRYELKALGWGGFTPGKMHWRENYDEGTMFLSVYTNLGVENRRALTLLSDLTEPSSSSMPF
ncbi:hypothetical protein LCGC14_1802440 [marine sediment metagenome]|uniref:Bacteriophage Mu GpT domain-containing protein n=1 Tax=marine sediment metagenome TaxID=412755 RepID=A0A0F9GPA8_9ZZZZ